MRAARLLATDSLIVCEIAEPIARAGNVVIKVGACGVCGTDRHIVHGDYSSAIPVTLGHEFAGTIVTAPPGSPLAPGQMVAVDPNIACGTCRLCRRGDVCLCPNRLA